VRSRRLSIQKRLILITAVSLDGFVGLKDKGYEIVPIST
jgi:hypothetical protein